MGAASEALEKKLHALIERACKMLALEVAKELRRKGIGTPVDTGHARANWIPAVGAPNLTEVGGASDAAYQGGVGQVLSYKIGQGTLYVSNVVPYVKRLNEGWSDQAPALFVEAAVARALVTVRSKTKIDLGVNGFVSSSGAGAAGNVADAYSPFGDE